MWILNLGIVFLHICVRNAMGSTFSEIEDPNTDSKADDPFLVAVFKAEALYDSDSENDRKPPSPFEWDDFDYKDYNKNFKSEVSSGTDSSSSKSRYNVVVDEPKKLQDKAAPAVSSVSQAAQADSSSDDSDVESDYSDSSSTSDEEVVSSNDDVDVEGVSSSDEKYYASQALKIKQDVTRVASHVEDHDYAAKPPMLSTQTVHSPQAKTTARSVQEPASWSSTYVNSPRRCAPTVNPPKAKTKARSAEASASLSRARALKTREVYKAFFGSPVRNARNSKSSAYATSAKPKPGSTAHKKESPPIGTKKRGRPPKRVLPESHAAKTSLTKKTKPNKPNVSIFPFTNPLADESVVEYTAMRSPDEAHLYVPPRSLMEDKQRRLNDMERRRRKHLKEAFSSLKDLVPSLALVQNAPIQQILKHAVTFIEQLKRREALQQKEIESLLMRKKYLDKHQRYLLLNQ